MPTYDTWERRNAIVALDLKTISRLLQPAFPGARAVAATPAHGGFGNTVYRVEVAGREDAVALRLCQRDPDASEREIHLWRHIRDAVPMPEVFYGSATGGPDGMAYNLSAWVEAEPAGEALRRAEDAPAVARALGATLAGLGAFTFPRAGFFGRDLTIAHPFEGGMVEGYLAHLEHCLLRDTAGRLLGEDLARRAWTFATESRPALEAIRDARSLVHSDYRPANILVRPEGAGWTVAAVIDWDFVHAGSPLGDVATILRHLPKDLEEKFLQGFTERGGALLEDWRRITRVLDLVTLADILNGSATRPTVIEDLTRLIEEATDI